MTDEELNAVDQAMQRAGFKRTMHAARLSREQAAVVTVYTGILIGSFDDAKRYASQLLGRPATELDFGSGGADQLAELAKDDFVAMSPTDDRGRDL